MQFEAGYGSHDNAEAGINFMISDDHKIYAEIEVDEGASDDYGYLTLMYAIMHFLTDEEQDRLVWWYPNGAEGLAPDAMAESYVYVRIDRDNEEDSGDDMVYVKMP